MSNPQLKSTQPTVAPILRVLLAGVAASAIVIPALIVSIAPPIKPRARVVAVPQRVVPQAELPPVEPLAYQNLDPQDARAFNKTVPFSTDPNPAARPFALSGTADDKDRALDCMATAMLYEAGDDTLGQRSVGQVVINRVRHPAFPKTICGVVFQGSERRTGCQFTFTCDGALISHKWSDVAWRRARETAKLALTGRVFKPVGYSTHYHTDWVVPYWQSSLDKVAQVRTHLFFRWTGWWGTPPAFRRAVTPSEPVIPALALYSDAHRTGAAATEAADAMIEATALAGKLPAPAAGDADSFLVTLDTKMPSESYAALAIAACADRTHCKFMGWSSKAKTPTTLPLQQAQVATMSFSYLRDRARNIDKPLWNCAEFSRPDRTQCMKQQVIGIVPAPRPTTEAFRIETIPGSRIPVPVGGAPRLIVDDLSGVRRRNDAAAPVPATKPTPTKTPDVR
jgi:spore germination cell wall hydrolase CwlJ-like protein